MKKLLKQAAFAAFIATAVLVVAMIGCARAAGQMAAMPLAPLAILMFFLACGCALNSLQPAQARRVKRRLLVTSFWLASISAVAFSGVFIYGLTQLGIRVMAPWVPLEGGLITLAIALRTALYSSVVVELVDAV